MTRNKLAVRKIVIVLSAFTLVLIGCEQAPKKQVEIKGNMVTIQDTVVVKQRNILDKSYQIGFYSKSYSYYWLVGADTLDFRLGVTEYEKDTTFSLNIYHKEPILFTTTLQKIEKCLPLIEEDFDISKLTSLHFRAPIFYLDLAKKLSIEYEQEFGQNNISYVKFDQFLLESNLTSQLNHFLNPLDKKVKRYGFEKFHLIDKKHYKEYLPNVDFAEYPEFTFNAHTGMFVLLENNK